METNHLTDLLNADPAAYNYFYSLSPRMQEQLRAKDIATLNQLREAVTDLDMDRRPAAF
ncbi:MAG: hypothetical protein KBS74_07995 [Clostridiales bacterium]|nr:hypothetical protein [Candidatus Cacconaster stercorequi]